MIIPKNRAVRQTWTTQLPFSLVNLLHKLFGQFHRFLISGLGIKQLLVCFQLFLATGYLRFFVNALDRIFAHFFQCGCLDRYLLSALALENASFPMETTFLPMITSFNLVHPANAFAEIFVTRKEYTTPFAFTLPSPVLLQI